MKVASSPRSGRMKIAHRFIGGDHGEYENGVREASGRLNLKRTDEFSRPLHGLTNWFGWFTKH
jgi:hypothetical protein